MLLITAGLLRAARRARLYHSIQYRIFLSLSLYLSLYMYTYISISLSLYIHICVYIYIYIHIHTQISIHIYLGTLNYGDIFIRYPFDQSLYYNILCVYIYIYIHTHYIYIHMICIPRTVRYPFHQSLYLHNTSPLPAKFEVLAQEDNQDSSKGGAVETGCSGLHYIIGCFIIQYYSHPLHSPPTAPPFDEYPDKSRAEFDNLLLQ